MPCVYRYLRVINFLCVGIVSILTYKLLATCPITPELIEAFDVKSKEYEGSEKDTGGGKENELTKHLSEIESPIHARESNSFNSNDENHELKSLMNEASTIDALGHFSMTTLACMSYPDPVKSKFYTTFTRNMNSAMMSVSIPASIVIIAFFGLCVVKQFTRYLGVILVCLIVTTMTVFVNFLTSDALSIVVRLSEARKLSKMAAEKSMDRKVYTKRVQNLIYDPTQPVGHDDISNVELKQEKTHMTTSYTMQSLWLAVNAILLLIFIILIVRYSR